MKVGFIAPLSISLVNGGVREQVMQTAKHLRDLGVDITFISPWETVPKMDIVHVFYAGAETLNVLSLVSALNIKTALSPVFFSNRSASVIRKSLRFEQFLSLLGSGIRSDFGIKAEACKKADIILPNTSDEAALLEKGLNIPKGNIQVVPNGVETRFLAAQPDEFVQKYGLKDFVLFVGQAGAPRKNVLSLLKAASELDFQVVIIGSFYSNSYGDECIALAKKLSNVTLIETLPHDSSLLSSAYAACKTFILPSYYETPGIAALEAALAGANIAITEKGGTKDYFLNHASYLDPKSVQSVKEAIKTSMKTDKSADLKNHILAHYTWLQVAENTLTIYKKLIH